MDLLQRLNAVAVSPAELEALLEKAEALGSARNGSAGGGLFLVAERYRGDNFRAFAVYSRLKALSQLVTAAHKQRWAMPPLPKGLVPTRGEMLAVAATHPLDQSGDVFAFESASFFTRVLEQHRRDTARHAAARGSKR